MEWKEERYVGPITLVLGAACGLWCGVCCCPCDKRMKGVEIATGRVFYLSKQAYEYQMWMTTHQMMVQGAPGQVSGMSRDSRLQIGMFNPVRANRVGFTKFAKKGDPLKGKWRVNDVTKMDAMIEKRKEKNPAKNNLQETFPEIPDLVKLRKLYGKDNVINEKLYLEFKFICDYVGFTAHQTVEMPDLKEFTGLPDNATLLIAPIAELEKLDTLPRFEEFQEHLVQLNLDGVSDCSEKLYPTKVYSQVAFISHKWDGNNPDPGNLIMKGLGELKEIQKIKYVWIDFTCTSQDEINIQEIVDAIRVIPHLRFWTPDYQKHDLLALQEGYEFSAWCNLEREMRKLERAVYQRRKELHVTPEGQFARHIMGKPAPYVKEQRKLHPQQDILFGDARSEQIFLETMIRLLKHAPCRNEYIDMARYFFSQTFVIMSAT